MQRQQKADLELLSSGKLIVTVMIVMVVMAVIGWRFAPMSTSLDQTHLEQEQVRWITVTNMLRSQWMTQGRPQQITAELHGSNQSITVAMSASGWPTPTHRTESGCQALWRAIQGTARDDQFANGNLRAGFDRSSKVCRYRVSDGSAMSYQVETGRLLVIEPKD
ncbi:hypothetical protein [Paraferrimonas haliotis]|uniref:MSHA biogenesis protein MshF n=1 Tax=Paraferrimonas haliotis TaxID=2013866 RepID=A0AA37TMF6_9GAMM|nr:hypothetical protein [Paraferrimonas haliotis]GLS82343.1 MSHA biogenesis protein MshF [Paraferrimonas haliotis]